MKTYLVYADKIIRHNYDAFVVVAENKNRALEIVGNKFKKNQGKITVTEINLSHEYVVLSSYND